MPKVKAHPETEKTSKEKRQQEPFLFRFEKGGSRAGLPVLVESRQVSDLETFQRYTIKRYKSEKAQFPDGTWQHKKITLSPDNKDFQPIILENVPEDDFRVVAEFVEVLKGSGSEKFN